MNSRLPPSSKETTFSNQSIIAVRGIPMSSPAQGTTSWWKAGRGKPDVSVNKQRLAGHRNSIQSDSISKCRSNVCKDMMNVS